MSDSEYSLPTRPVSNMAPRDDEYAFEYTPYSSGKSCVPYGTNIATRLVVALLSLVAFIFAILGLVLDLAGFDIKLDYGFATVKIPLERYKAFSYREVYTGSPDTSAQKYTGKDKAGIAAAQAFLIIAVIFSFVAFALAVTLVVLRVVYERERRRADVEREAERSKYKNWLRLKREHREELRRAGRSTAELDAETYSRAVPPSTYSSAENRRRKVDQDVGIALFAFLIVAIFAFFMALVVFAGAFFFRYVVISDTENVGATYFAGFWLVLVGLLLVVIAMVLVVVYFLSGVCVCASDACTNRTTMVHADGTDYARRPASAKKIRSIPDSQMGSDNPMSTAGVLAAGAVPVSVSCPRAGEPPAPPPPDYYPKEGKRLSGDSEMSGFDAVKKRKYSDNRDEISATTIPASNVVVANGVPMALPGPAVPSGFSAEDLQRQLQSGSQPSSSSQQPRSSDRTNYENLGLPAPQYQVPQSYQPTTQRQQMMGASREL